MYDVLSEDFDLRDFSVKPSSKVRNKKPSIPKKLVDPTTEKMVSLQSKLADFEYDYPIGAILYHHDGKDKFEIFNLKFSHSFFVELLNKEVKEITLSVIEQIINDKRKNLGEVSVWGSYFTTDTLKKLTDQEHFETPTEFKSTFDLVRGESITCIKFYRVIVFDFRVSNSKQEFIYLSNGSRVYFGNTFDDFCVQKRRSVLERMMAHYERSLKHFNLDKVYDARDEIFRLSDDHEIRDTAYNAERFIARYVHIHHENEEIELKNLLQYKNWADDLKIDYERATEYRDELFTLLRSVKDSVKRREKAKELKDEEAYPSL